MGLRIQNNVEAFNAHRQLTGTASKAAKAMEKLASGYRVNRAADDAAGLAISEKMRGQIGGLAQAQRNAQDAVSLVQTGEGALNEVHSMLQRIRDLKVQYSQRHARDRRQAAISAEVQQLGKEISDITTKTEFNGIKLLTAGTVTFQVGAESADTIALTKTEMSAAVGTGRHRRSRRVHRHRLPPPPWLPPTLSAPRHVARQHRRGDQERLERPLDVRRDPEPSGAPPQQPLDLPGEPGGVGEPDPRRGHGPARWSTSRSSGSCSRPARACSRRPTRLRRTCFRCCAKHRQPDNNIAPPRDGSMTGGHYGRPSSLKPRSGGCRITGREHHPSHALHRSRVPAQRGRARRPARRAWSRSRPPRPTPSVLVVDDASPVAELVAQARARVRGARHRLRLQRRELGLLQDRQRRPRAAPTPWATTPCSSTPTSSSRAAGWLDRMRERTDTEGRPAAVVGARLLYPNGLHPARRRDLLAAHPRLAAPLPLRAVQPARGAQDDALHRDRRAAVHPLGDARPDRPLRRGLPALLRGRRLLPARLQGRAASASTSRPSSPCTTRASSAASATPEIERWTKESTARMRALWGAEDLSRWVPETL